MKINWFSPLPPTKTKISEYTEKLLPHLSKVAEIIVWTEQEFWDAELQKFAEIYHYQPHSIPWDIINKGDLNLYHLDNNPNFHTTIWNISQSCPGLVMLHEINLHDYFSAIHLNTRRNLMTLALENAIGIIVHDQKAYHLIKHNQNRFTGYIQLPFWEENDQVKNYIKAMIDFAEMTKKYRSYPLTNQLVETVAKEIKFFTNNQALKPNLHSVTNAIDFLIS